MRATILVRVLDFIWMRHNRSGRNIIECIRMLSTNWYLSFFNNSPWTLIDAEFSATVWEVTVGVCLFKKALWKLFERLVSCFFTLINPENIFIDFVFRCFNDWAEKSICVQVHLNICCYLQSDCGINFAKSIQRVPRCQ